jgi:hypothetical protein
MAFSNSALAPTTAGGPITMSSCGEDKHATEHDGSTLRLSRIVPDSHIDLFGNKHSMLDMGIELSANTFPRFRPRPCA